ncbi:MAG: MBOAT family protein [Oscillospiraceae bacterium]|jgi:alginate O-acetyltransferase complex protein AlgI|nr:MBOAT family protein [Oscillospiraceae bacterium]
MVFSSPTFLYYFLPITVIVYFLTPMIKGSPRWRNITLLVASLIFYAWGEPRYVFLMIAQCIVAWGFSLLIEKYQENKKLARIFMFISISVSLAGLIYFKYANFFIGNVNNLTNSNIPFIRMIMPIGISFYTFQFVSYTLDLYNRKFSAQRNLLDFSTYVASFPQLIAGPIVRYTDIAEDLVKRVHTWSHFSMGSRRFILGLGKKMLLANLFGELVEVYKVSGDRSVLFVWLYVIAYSFQIYFDFSGYSDMAIGLGQIFGFKFPENFNYPYIADSITNFWRRWHMTLSGWFRDYVYIPLGGNRVKQARFIFNIMVVWMLTGFWHGADWNFILWGGYFGVILLVEKFFLGKLLDKTYRPFRHIYVMLIVFVSWAFFDALSFQAAFDVIGRMIGVSADSLASNEALYYLRSYMIPIILGVVGCTPLVMNISKKIDKKKTAALILEPLVLLVILLLSTAAMVDGSFNPFIYFRF